MRAQKPILGSEHASASAETSFGRLEARRLLAGTCERERRKLVSALTTGHKLASAALWPRSRASGRQLPHASASAESRFLHSHWVLHWSRPAKMLLFTTGIMMYTQPDTMTYLHTNTHVPHFTPLDTAAHGGMIPTPMAARRDFSLRNRFD